MQICVVTGSRAEYGLLRSFLHQCESDPEVCLTLVVTGAHLSPEFGFTVSDIEKDGFKISRRVELQLSSDSKVGMAKSVGLGVISFSDVLDHLRPDVCVLLGDRFEIFSVATAAFLQGIPVAHVHGGELTIGAIDDSIRHAITKMASIHFVAADDYRRRVIQLGEHPGSVFVIGAPGLDEIKFLKPLSRHDLQLALNHKFCGRLILVTYHPVTNSPDLGLDACKNLLTVLETYEDATIIVSGSNADAGGRQINELIKKFANGKKNVLIIPSVGRQVYLSLLQEADAMVGNSSSGLLEAPFCGCPVLDVGPRQHGRVLPRGVLSVDESIGSIAEGIKKILGNEFRGLAPEKNLYWKGGAGSLMLSLLKLNSKSLMKPKTFYDQPDV